MKAYLRELKTFDLILIAMMAALGIAVKPLIVPLVHLISGPLLIPGGAVAGGLYMMWLVLGAAMVGKRGIASLIGFIQAIIVIATGVFGTHGIVSLITYTLPGAAIDLTLWVGRFKPNDKLGMFLAGMAANVCGVALSNLVFFRLPLIPFILSMSVGALSGAFGGLLAWLVYDRLKRLKVSDI